MENRFYGFSSLQFLKVREIVASKENPEEVTIPSPHQASAKVSISFALKLHPKLNLNTLGKDCERQIHMLLFICTTIRGLRFFLLQSLHNGLLLKQFKESLRVLSAATVATERYPEI